MCCQFDLPGTRFLSRSVTTSISSAWHRCMCDRVLLFDPSPVRAGRFAAVLRRIPGVVHVEAAILTRHISDAILDLRPGLVIVVTDGHRRPSPSPRELGLVGPGTVVRHLSAVDLEAFLDRSSMARTSTCAPPAGGDTVGEERSGSGAPCPAGPGDVVALLTEIEACAAIPHERAAPSATVMPSGTCAGVSPTLPTCSGASSMPLVCIGASTGGLPVIEGILRTYPPLCPPTLIVQHIRGSFTAGLAERLSRLCRAEVSVAFHDAPIKTGQVYLAPGDVAHLEVSDGPMRGGATDFASRCRLVECGKISGHRPSVDALFRSAARQGPRVIGVLLTGMGRDGAEGLLEIRRNGGSTLAQDAGTSVVFGMPRVAAELGAVQHVLPAPEIGPAILRLSSKTAENRGSRRT